jgi:hypothetical protein
MTTYPHSSDLRQPPLDEPTARPTAKPNGGGADEALPEGVSLDDFFSYLPSHSYIFAPTRQMWPASSVNARLPWIMGGDGKMVAPARWIDQNKPVEQMTWAPGEPLLIRDRLIADGGWFKRQGVSVFNLYRPPTIEPGRPLNDDLPPFI